MPLVEVGTLKQPIPLTEGPGDIDLWEMASIGCCSCEEKSVEHVHH